MKKGLTLTVVLLVVAAALAVWSFVDKGNVQKKLDEATAQVQTLTKDAETKAADVAKEVEGLKAEAETKAAEAVAALDAAKAEAQTKVSELTAQIATLTGDLETAKTQAPGYKYGLGTVTSIGSVAEATAEKPGAAQVNTTIASLVLDAEGKIVSVTWDVQQTKIQFSLEGKPVNLPEDIKSKLEIGAAYGMIKASQIGKEWNEQIEAFAEYAKGKTVEEMLSIPTFQRDDAHPSVPDVEELKASVSIDVGGYLAALKKAAENAK